MLAHMVARGALFVAWAVVGAVASYGAPYVLTGYGLMILGTCLFAGVSLAAYALAGRALCARGRPPTAPRT